MGIGYKGGIAREALDFQNIADGNLDMVDYHIYMGAGAIGNDDEILTFASGATGLASFAGGVTLTTGNLTLTAGNLLIGANGIGNNASVLTFAATATGLATLGGALTIAGDLTMGSNDLIMGTGLIGYDGTALKGLSFDSGNEKVVLESGQLFLPAGSATAPALVLGAGLADGFHLSAANTIGVDLNGILNWEFKINIFQSTTTNGAYIEGTASTATNPSFAFVGDRDTGMVRVAADSVGLTAGGVLGLSVTEATTINIDNFGTLARHTTASITASTTQSQGQGPLTADVNEVSVCGNSNDVVTLPTARAGMRVIVINNGAQTLQIFPASSDDLGAGVNSSTTLAAASNVVFTAYDDTNWEQI